MKSLLLTSPPSFFSDHYFSSQLKFATTHHLHHSPISTPFITLSSSSSSSPVVQEEQQDSDIPFNGCKGCGKEETESGCNGEGRIQGGIATYPGFGWWPIKAYRPCPGFLASGGNYRRRGQSLDEVAFGGGKGRPPVDDFDDTETRKQGKNRKQFKS